MFSALVVGSQVWLAGKGLSIRKRLCGLLFSGTGCQISVFMLLYFHHPWCSHLQCLQQQDSSAQLGCQRS